MSLELRYYKIEEKRIVAVTTVTTTDIHDRTMYLPELMNKDCIATEVDEKEYKNLLKELAQQ